MQVRGDMVDANGPMGPDQMKWGGWWSVLRTLGSAHPRVRESHQLLKLNSLDNGFTRKCVLYMHMLYVCISEQSLI